MLTRCKQPDDPTQQARQGRVQQPQGPARARARRLDWVKEISPQWIYGLSASLRLLSAPPLEHI